MKKSIWWALCCVYWYWRSGLPLFSLTQTTAWYHGFLLRDVMNSDTQLLEDNDEPSEAVATDISYWEE